ncbi:hypothetical protein OQA88_4703 [Cercophora sp. LCS_1]
MSSPDGDLSMPGSRDGSIPEPDPQISTESQEPQPKVKRTRILLSCAPCRISKLKCDRQQPCRQCVKKGRVDSCVYAPKPEKPVAQPRSMTARLKRLEAMVRGMMDAGEGDGEGVAATLRERQQRQPNANDSNNKREQASGQVVFGRATTYVGATHFLAMLDDVSIEDLKSYFDDDENDSVDGLSPDQVQEPSDTDLLLMSASGPMSKRDIINILPNRQVVDRLVQRYFGAGSPTQPLVHRPTFLRQYNQFWENPYDTPMEWLALLLMVMALGTFFSIYSAPHEVSYPGGSAPIDMYRRYRAAAGWALVAAKYTSPCMVKMQAYTLYVTAEFMTNRASSANCYVLSAVGMRLMLQMGLHRDPSRLPNISPFDGEMRRRMWHLASQIELLVSFHMGLPSMLNGLESDVVLQSNLSDEDIYPGMTSLPPSKPDSEPTTMTYARCKSAICVVFGQIAAQTNSTTVPAYSEVMRLDALLEEKWKQVPSFLMMKPLADSVGDLPVTVHQRFGLASLYQKSRCVLHRRYITEASPKKEHAYSRRVCLDAAISMLGYQEAMHLATLPGGSLRDQGWFLAALVTYDFLIAATIIFILYQSKTYEDDEAYTNAGWRGDGGPLRPTKGDLLEVLRRSHQIWVAVTKETPVAKKAADMLETMLRRIDEASEKKALNGESQSQFLQWQRQSTLADTGLANPQVGVSLNSTSHPLFPTLCVADGDRDAGVIEQPWSTSFSPGETSQPTLPIDDALARQLMLDETSWLDPGVSVGDVDWVRLPSY